MSHSRRLTISPITHVPPFVKNRIKPIYKFVSNTNTINYVAGWVAEKNLLHSFRYQYHRVLSLLLLQLYHRFAELLRDLCLLLLLLVFNFVIFDIELNFPLPS